jgi:hypothetical protein
MRLRVGKHRLGVALPERGSRAHGNDSEKQSFHR